MSNSKKGAIVLYFIAMVLIGYSIFGNEWRIRFAYTKDPDGAQWEQSERYGLKGMEMYFGCKKGCLNNKKKNTSHEVWNWEKMISDSKRRLNNLKEKGREPGTMGIFHAHAQKASTVALIMLIIAWLSIATALGFLVTGFIKKIKIPRKAYLLAPGVIGSLHIVFAFYTSATLRVFSKAFYAHATYNPTQVKAHVSLTFFATVIGGALLALAGVIQYLDKGNIMERFILENLSSPQPEDDSKNDDSESNSSHDSEDPSDNQNSETDNSHNSEDNSKSQDPSENNE
jgi:hypothetical protein